MGTVTIKIPPAPDQVRTARVLAVTMARRAGVAESLIDEIRLAIGEACGRAVHAHIARALQEPITILLSDGDGFEALVVDLASHPEPARLSAQTGRPRYRGAEDAAAIGLAVLGAVVDDVTIEPISPIGTRVRMRWPTDNAGQRGSALSQHID